MATEQLPRSRDLLAVYHGNEVSKALSIDARGYQVEQLATTNSTSYARPNNVSLAKTILVLGRDRGSFEIVGDGGSPMLTYRWNSREPAIKLTRLTQNMGLSSQVVADLCLQHVALQQGTGVLVVEFPKSLHDAVNWSKVGLR